MLPNFIHAGVPKSGSMTIQLLLAHHPKVYLPKAKEQNFFSNDARYKRGPEWYEKTFYEDTGDATIVGDLSIGYASGLSVDVPERIVQCLGRNVKILFTVRNPVDRAYSNYCMAHYKGRFDRLSFHDSIRRALAAEDQYDKQRVRQLQSGSYYRDPEDLDVYRYAVYVRTGLYATILKEYQSQFGKDNIHVILLDELAKDAEACMEGLFSFLGIGSAGCIPYGIRANESTALRFPVLKDIANIAYRSTAVRTFLNEVMSIKVRGRLKRLVFSRNYVKNESRGSIDPPSARLLQDYYRNDIHELSQMIGRDVSGWSHRY